MFEPQNAHQEFEKVLSGRGLRERDLSLAGAVGRFSISTGITGHRDPLFEQHEDADMLLFQWGTHDWGTGEHFAFNLTRQLIVGDGEDDDIWQLSLTFEFEPDNEFRALSGGNK